MLHTLAQSTLQLFKSLSRIIVKAQSQVPYSVHEEHLKTTRESKLISLKRVHYSLNKLCHYGQAAKRYIPQYMVLSSDCPAGLTFLSFFSTQLEKVTSLGNLELPSSRSSAVRPLTTGDPGWRPCSLWGLETAFAEGCNLTGGRLGFWFLPELIFKYFSLNINWNRDLN